MDVFRDEGAETGGEGLFSPENGAWEEPAKSTLTFFLASVWYLSLLGSQVLWNRSLHA